LPAIGEAAPSPVGFGAPLAEAACHSFALKTRFGDGGLSFIDRHWHLLCRLVRRGSGAYQPGPRRAYGRLNILRRQPFAGLLDAPQWILLAVGDVFEEPADIRNSQLPRMPLAMEENETADPLGKAFAGLRSAEALICDLSKLIQQSRRLSHHNRR